MDAVIISAVVTGVSTLVLCIVTGSGLFYAGKQLSEQRKVAETTNEQLDEQKKIAHGQFLLELDKMFRFHTEVHLNLRPGGAWHIEQDTPVGPAKENSKDWAAVDEYMALFESNEQARLGSPELRGRGIDPEGRLPDLDGLRLRPQTYSQQAAGNVPATIQVLIDKEVIDLETVDRMYGYRLLNIVKNPIIVR